MGTFKEAFTIAGMGEAAEEDFDKKDIKDTQRISGIAGDPLYEPCPQHIQTSTEKVIKNDHNACIVLGRDRPSSRVSGYGGRGDTQAGAIDMCVGRMGSAPIKYTIDNQKVWANPDFKKDAARIYMSQKSDVDKDFDLAGGSIGSPGRDNASPRVPRSCIALKADGVRLIAREGIKLITRTDTQNSQGGTIQGIQGVDIIAGNNDKDLQPMVKGDNLALALERIVVHVYDLAGIVDTLLMHQMSLNKAVTNHFHFSPFFGHMTTCAPSVQAAGNKTVIGHLSQTKRSLSNHMTNLSLFTQTYLTDGGDKYINSRYNNTN